MFVIAAFIGGYAYAVFLLGIFGLLYKSFLSVLTLITLVLFIIVLRKRLVLVISPYKIWNKNIKAHKKLFVLLVCLLSVQAVVNFIGALGPELAFDALWYHLTLPQLYLLHHALYPIPGGLLYYSEMPKLGEMLFVAGQALGNEITVKLLHFSFGLLCCLSLYIFSRRFFSPMVSLLAVVIFYANIVVAWESTTAYIDLIRTFFELLALWAFVLWEQTKVRKWFLFSAIFVGLAITTKLLAISSLIIFCLLIIYLGRKKRRQMFRDILTYAFLAIVIPLPWFIFSYVHTGNPVYPFFTPLYHVTPNSPNPLIFIKDVWDLFIWSSDPISPIYLIMLPLIILSFSKMKHEVKIIAWYSFLSILSWYFTPRTGGGRFILPYLPALSLLCAAVMSILQEKKQRFLYLFLLVIIVFVSILSIAYRSAANAKYVPVLLGIQTKDIFLANHLNFSYGDFYDTDNYFKTHIKKEDVVLLYGFHNLYYVDFPYIDASWVRKGDRFDYIATQNAQISKRFADWTLVYTNKKTLVKLYKPTKGQCHDQCIY